MSLFQRPMYHLSEPQSQPVVKPVNMNKVSLVVALFSFLPTLLRLFVDIDFFFILGLLGIFILSNIYFIGLSLYNLYKFKLKQTILSLVGLGIAILPVTPIGFTISAQCALTYHYGPFHTQVENIRKGVPKAHSVRGYEVLESKNPDRVLFERSNIFHVTGFVYSPTGFIDSDRYSCSLQIKISLLGDWYFCVWD